MDVGMESTMETRICSKMIELCLDAQKELVWARAMSFVGIYGFPPKRVSVFLNVYPGTDPKLLTTAYLTKHLPANDFQPYVFSSKACPPAADDKFNGWLCLEFSVPEPTP